MEGTANGPDERDRCKQSTPPQHATSSRGILACGRPGRGEDNGAPNLAGLQHHKFPSATLLALQFLSHLVPLAPRVDPALTRGKECR